MKNSKNLWRWWAKALGEKATINDREADHIASIRTVIFITYLITNIFIVAGVIRHWNRKTNVYVEIRMEEPVVPNLLIKSQRSGEF
jgi:hypothetical protein